jgi:5-methylcytosine-specific restriction protein B
MRIKASGTVLENPGNGKRIKVVWDRNYQLRDWYFFTYRSTLVRVDTERPDAQKLIDFAFGGKPQDYEWFLRQPYWVAEYGGDTHVLGGLETTLPAVVEEVIEAEEETSYTVESIVGDGCFLSVQALQQMLERCKIKKNLILQGPPGTGKTWLAKRLGFAMVGSSDRKTTRSRLRIVQFHPSLAYEDFVRGWRPNGDGKLVLQDGILMQCIDAALSEPDKPFVLVIEEINRGNPAQIFGEMLTLLEDTKRNNTEEIELAYSKGNERIHIPENLYVIGTMNIADRSLAIVDLALRRRFAFVDLEPALGQSWRDWCIQRGMTSEFISEIGMRVSALNDAISSAPSLGKQFRLGHSYVTPGPQEHVEDSVAWFRARVESEIAPLLNEYWYDSPEHAADEKEKLLAGLAK